MHKPETLKNQALSNINISQDEGLWTDEDHRMRYVQAKRCAGGMGEALVPHWGVWGASPPATNSYCSPYL